MRKPKMRKYKNYWLVYRNKKQVCKCYSKQSAFQWYGVLLQEIENEKRAC